MSRKRVTTWTMVLVLGVACRVTIAAPRATTAEIRAAVCCTEHCPTATRRPMTSKRCCFVESGATDPASAPIVSLLERPLPTVAALLVPSLDLASLAARPALDPLALCRAGPPAYLRIQKLQR
jgi:hypothetical protein